MPAKPGKTPEPTKAPHASTADLDPVLGNLCSDCHAPDLDGPSLALIKTSPHLAMKAAIRIAALEMPPASSPPLDEHAKLAFFANACGRVPASFQTCMKMLQPESDDNSLARPAHEVVRAVRRAIATGGHEAASAKQVDSALYLQTLHRKNLSVEHYDPSLEVARILLVADLCRDEKASERCVKAGLARKAIVMPDQR